jgi:phage shock protein B
MDVTAIFAMFCIFVAPLWLNMHYTTPRRRAQGLTREDEKLLSDLWQIANRMESRVKTLETILDTQIPNWRDKA